LGPRDEVSRSGQMRSWLRCLHTLVARDSCPGPDRQRCRWSRGQALIHLPEKPEVSNLLGFSVRLVSLSLACASPRNSERIIIKACKVGYVLHLALVADLHGLRGSIIRLLVGVGLACTHSSLWFPAPDAN